MEIVTQETWKPIPGYEDYLISNLGEVRSLYRKGDRLLKISINNGYKKVGLFKQGKQRSKAIHRLLMLAFTGPVPEGMQVRHIDGNPLNNNLENLAYGTNKENMADMLLHGTNFSASKTKCKAGHPFNKENTYNGKTKSGFSYRKCRVCARERMKSYSSKRTSLVGAA